MLSKLEDLRDMVPLLTFMGESSRHDAVLLSCGLSVDSGVVPLMDALISSSSKKLIDQ